MKKTVVFDERANEAFNKLPNQIKEEFFKLMESLETEGYLVEPEGKKLNKDLYEMRVRVRTAWRSIYAYISDDRIIVLDIFQKQSRKTPQNHLRTAEKRFKQYL